jgi:hypothetical protein
MIIMNKEISDLLGFVTGLLRRIIRVFYVRMSACSIRMLNENVKIVLAVDKDLILYHSTLLQILEFLECHHLIV